jgi:hypothetical protein
MVQLGMRQARYRGRQKTLFQALLTAAVANLTLVAASARGGSEMLGSRSRNWAPQEHPGLLSKALTRLFVALVSKLASTPARLPAFAMKPAFRPGF